MEANKPAFLDDPLAPHPAPPKPVSLPQIRTVYLKDHVTAATVIPIFPYQSIPHGLLSFLHNEFNNEIERGDTYPLEEPLDLDHFRASWFGTFAAVMLKGHGTIEALINSERSCDWSQECLGTFYVKPNYPGRCKHVCNGGFLVVHSARGKGVGKLLVEAYLNYSPQLGYTYSVFNLVFETNTAAVKVYESLGFKRVGLIKGAARLKGHSQPVNAIIFGRDLGDDEDYVSEERFDKIRYYLEKGKYPPSADRSEKSRLRSATTHYRLENGKLMLKGKEVIADAHKQYEIAKRIHSIQHGGINKTTAQITDKYHWVRIKETVSQVIKNCSFCKEQSHAPVMKPELPQSQSHPQLQGQPQPQPGQMQTMSSSVSISSSPGNVIASPASLVSPSPAQLNVPSTMPGSSSITPNLTPNTIIQTFDLNSLPHAAIANLQDLDIPVDPAMIEEVHRLNANVHHQFHHQQQPQMAPVAQMHVASVHGIIATPDNTDILGGRQPSSVHSAEIARAALTEEDRAMRDHNIIEYKLVEGMKSFHEIEGPGMDLSRDGLS